MTSLVQLQHPGHGRRVARVEANELVLLDEYNSAYELAWGAVSRQGRLSELIDAHQSGNRLDYDAIHAGRSDWKLLPAFDFPHNPTRCLVTGTGLTHKNSALDRDGMRKGKSTDAEMSDSMKMYNLGVEGGRPRSGKAGAQPEWFYKGEGDILKAHGDALEVLPFADDGGEEPEVAGIYIIDPQGTPYRVGFSTGNEFSDHVMEKVNYLYLTHSKLRQCALGPELIIGQRLDHVQGEVAIKRQGEIIWSKPIKTGNANMCHSIENLEHHHFKYAKHRRPGDAHVHFFGADGLSFGENIFLQEDDVMEIHWKGMGRPLQNRVKILKKDHSLLKVKVLD